jgi:hypothetical protein
MHISHLLCVCVLRSVCVTLPLLYSPNDIRWENKWRNPSLCNFLCPPSHSAMLRILLSLRCGAMKSGHVWRRNLERIMAIMCPIHEYFGSTQLIPHRVIRSFYYIIWIGNWNSIIQTLCDNHQIGREIHVSFNFLLVAIRKFLLSDIF